MIVIEVLIATVSFSVSLIILNMHVFKKQFSKLEIGFLIIFFGLGLLIWCYFRLLGNGPLWIWKATYYYTFEKIWCIIRFCTLNATSPWHGCLQLNLYASIWLVLFHIVQCMSRNEHERDATVSIKAVLVGAAMLGFIMPAKGVSFGLSSQIVGALAFTIAAVWRNSESTPKASDDSL